MNKIQINQVLSEYVFFFFPFIFFFFFLPPLLSSSRLFYSYSSSLYQITLSSNWNVSTALSPFLEEEFFYYIYEYMLLNPFLIYLDTTSNLFIKKLDGIIFVTTFNSTIVVLFFDYLIGGDDDDDGISILDLSLVMTV